MKLSTPSNYVLVTGSYRCGSTFLGTMLALDKHTAYIREPFNPLTGIEGISHWFTYLRPGTTSEKEYKRLITSLLEGNARYKRKAVDSRSSLSMNMAKLLFRSRGNLCYWRYKLKPRIQNVLIKDPIACLASEYLHLYLNFKTIILIRHPAAFCDSVGKLDYPPGPTIQSLRAQPELMNDFLNPYFNYFEPDKLSRLERYAFIWLCLNKVLTTFAERNPAIHLLRYEDLAGEPLTTIKDIYNRLGLHFTPAIEKKIMSYTDSRNPANITEDHKRILKRNSRETAQRWKSAFNQNELTAIHNVTKEIADKYYG